MTELTKLQKNILKQSEYELREWLVDGYIAAERRHQMAIVSIGHETDVEWHGRKMYWLKKFIKLMEEGDKE
jgi:hypothetical protein